jgi:crossover junction endodeoxyribonuclease RuvC
MRILGIDPGSRVTGWGVVHADGWELRAIGAGAIRCGEGPLSGRLVRLAGGLDEILAEHDPAAAVVEQVFAARNARSALVLGHARGVALLAVARAGLPLHEYSAMQVKNAVTGYGRAGKEQVRQAVTTQLLLREPPSSTDASDALAIAICHAAAVRLDRRLAVEGRAGSRP